MEMKVWISVFLGIQIGLCYAGIPTKDAPSNVNCESFRDVLERSVVESAAIYFSENTLPDRPPFSPSTVKPLNALNLYRSYYGEGASPEALAVVMWSILYSDPASDQKAQSFDKVDLRRRIYMQARAQNFDLARTLFGKLLYDDISEFGEEHWKTSRCIMNKNVKLAEEIVTMEISRLRSEIGEWSFKKFLAFDVGTTLAFVIDETGSMAEEIEAVRRRTRLLIDERQGSLDQPQNFVIVPFNDPKVGPATSTSDPDKIKIAIDRLDAHGGGDLPELSMRGILLALDKCPPGSTIYVITDAEAKDADLQDEVIAMADKKGIKLTFLLTARMTSWLCAGFSSTRRLAACRDPSLKLGFELYEHLANSTGGETLVVRRNNIFKATELVDISLKHGLVNLEKRTLKVGDGNIDFVVDSDVKELYVHASGSCESVRVRTNGSPVPFEASVKVSHLFVGSLNVTKYGKYKLVVNTKRVCRVTISAKSTKGFGYTTARLLGNETTSQYLEVFQHDPSPSKKTTVLIDMYGLRDIDVVRTISFVDEKAGGVLHSVTVKDATKKHFQVELAGFRNKTLLVYVDGTDANGFQFRRLAKRNIRFSDVELDCSAVNEAVIRAGTPTQVPVIVRNIESESDYYTIGATDDKNFITSVSQARILVSADREGKFFLRLRAPGNTSVGTVSTVTITVKDQNGTLVYKECHLTVSPKPSPTIEYFKITSNINIRFAETIVQSKFVNDGWTSREAAFFAVVPKGAFITEFTMTTGGETYVGEIKELGEAKKFYEVGKRQGVTHGTVSAADQETVFKTSVNLKGDEDVVFQLKYQQQLSRIVSKYRHGVHVQPGQAVNSLTVEVNIHESLPVVDLRAMKFETEQAVLPGELVRNDVTITNSGKSAKVTYSPTKEQQTKLSPFGLNGKFSIEYDLSRPTDTISDLVGFENNFLHFIVPEYDVMGRRIVFLLDNSGSMFGHKLKGLKNAMNLMLDELNPKDSFSILFSDSKVQTWDPHPGDDAQSIMVPASPDNIANAKKFLSSTAAQAGTDILKGLEAAINVIDGYVEDENIQPHFSTDFIFMVNDGLSSEGETNTDAIVSTITNLNKLKFAINTVAFGHMADASTLSAISTRNRGKSTQAYQDLKDTQKIKYFFDTLAFPTLRNIVLRYPSKLLIPTTKTRFRQYQRGTEIVVAGRFTNDTKCQDVSKERETEVADFTLSAETDGEDVFVEEKLFPGCDDVDTELEDLIERQEKHLEIVDALTELEVTQNQTLVDELREKISNLSTENNFVVPNYTALVVSKPDDIKEIDETIAAELDEEVRRLEESTPTPTPTTPSTSTRRIPAGSFVTPAFGSIPSTTSVPFTASRPRLEFFGDPHFVIDIEQQITLCFNWDGKDGQTINLLHDPTRGITVNGRLVTSTSPTNNARVVRTYVDKLGISLKDKNISMLITSKEIVLHMTGKGKERISLSFGKYGTQKRKSITLKMRPVTKFKSTLFIRIQKNIVFRVISRINSKNSIVRDHLDFAVIRGDGLAESAVGVLGQFSRFRTGEKAPASIEFRTNGKTALLWYRHNPIEVSYHILKDYNTDRDIECWYMADKKQLWENDEDMFVVKGILDSPRTMKRARHR